MSDEPINIEEAEVSAAGPRGDSDHLYLLIAPSPKTYVIRQGGLVTFRGTLYTVKTKGETGTPGGPVEFILLKADKAERHSS